MKKLLLTVISVVLLLSASTYGQTVDEYKAFMKERKEMQKLTKEELNVKIDKESKKEVKAKKKAGWLIPLGALSLEQQVQRAKLMQSELDVTTGMQKYVSGNGIATAASYDAAKMKATANAKTQLAGNIRTEIAAIVETKLGTEENVTLDNAIEVSKQVIIQNLQHIIPVVECYREKNGQYEVQVMIFCAADAPMKAAKAKIKEELEKKGEKLANELDTLLGF